MRPGKPDLFHRPRPPRWSLDMLGKKFDSAFIKGKCMTKVRDMLASVDLGKELPLEESYRRDRVPIRNQT
jgi:hypothetical protein